MNHDQPWIFLQPGFYYYVYLVSFPGRYVGKDFLLHEFNVTIVYIPAGFWKEQLHKFSKEGFQQFFKQAVVVNLVFDHPAIAPVFNLIYSLHRAWGTGKDFQRKSDPPGGAWLQPLVNIPCSFNTLKRDGAWRLRHWPTNFVRLLLRYYAGV
jgi:hypothetical protein